jgi:transposase
MMTVNDAYTAQELLSMAKAERDGRVVRRLQAVALARQGYTAGRIAELTGQGQRTVQQSVKRYNEGGVEGLRDRARSGCPPKLARSQEPALRERLAGGPRESDPHPATFTGEDIRGILSAEFGAEYSLNGVYARLHRLGYSWLCPRPRHEQADAEAQERFKKKPWAKR